MFTPIKQLKDNDHFLASSTGHLKASKCPDLATKLEIPQKMIQSRKATAPFSLQDLKRKQNGLSWSLSHFSSAWASISSGFQAGSSSPRPSLGVCSYPQVPFFIRESFADLS